MENSSNCKTLKPQKGFLEIKKRRRKKHRVKERDEWCRSTRFLLQRSSTPWLCCSLCLQGTTFLSLSLKIFCSFFYTYTPIWYLSLFGKEQLLQMQKQHKLIKVWFISSRPRLRPWCLASGFSIWKTIFFFFFFMGFKGCLCFLFFFFYFYFYLFIYFIAFHDVLFCLLFFCCR